MQWYIGLLPAQPQDPGRRPRSLSGTRRVTRSGGQGQPGVPEGTTEGFFPGAGGGAGAGEGEGDREGGE